MRFFRRIKEFFYHPTLDEVLLRKTKELLEDPFLTDYQRRAFTEDLRLYERRIRMARRRI